MKMITYKIQWQHGEIKELSTCSYPTYGGARNAAVNSMWAERWPTSFSIVTIND